MAENRMFLCYKPLGLAVFLGKKSMQGWWGAPEDLPERLTKLYESAEKHSHEWPDRVCADSFSLLKESNKSWKYAKPFPGEHNKPLQNVCFFEEALPAPPVTSWCKGCYYHKADCKCEGGPP